MKWARGALVAKRSRPTPEEARPTPGKKDTRSWCRGKKGREHRPECLTYREAKGIAKDWMPDFASAWRLLVCAECGKELARWSPWCAFRPGSVVVCNRGSRGCEETHKPPPEWVT